MRFPIALGSIDPEGASFVASLHILDPLDKFLKLLSPHVEPHISVLFATSIKSIRQYVTNKREWQFGVEGRVGKLDGGFRKWNTGIESLISGNRKLVDGCNSLQNVIPSLTSTSSEF